MFIDSCPWDSGYQESLETGKTPENAGPDANVEALVYLFETPNSV